MHSYMSKPHRAMTESVSQYISNYRRANQKRILRFQVISNDDVTWEFHHDLGAIWPWSHRLNKTVIVFNLFLFPTTPNNCHTWTHNGTQMHEMQTKNVLEQETDMQLEYAEKPTWI